MMGELVYEAQGKVAGWKQLVSGKVEEKFDMHGTFLGEMFSGTYAIEGNVRPDGTGFIETHGFISTEGGYPVQFTGITNGRTYRDGHTVLRGANCFCCPSGKFAHLNEMAVIWEAEVDDEGNVRSKGWEWK